jgi:CRP-like cAMP-binding protein
VSDEERAAALTALRAYPDVQAVRLGRGQVLQYPGHYPLGIWVVLEGSLRLLPGGGSLPTQGGPFLLPALADLDGPAECGAVVETAAEALFIPHSLAREDAAVRRLVRQCALEGIAAMREER